MACIITGVINGDKLLEMYYNPANLAYASLILPQAIFPYEKRDLSKKDSNNLRINPLEPLLENTLYYKTGKFIGLDKFMELNLFV